MTPTDPGPPDLAGLDLRGRVAVVIGASRGLGAGLARAFAERGLRLGVCARGASALEPGPGVVARRLDVTDAGAVLAFAGEVARALGPIDLWVNNAAVLEPIGPLRELDPGAVRRHFEVNVLGVVHGSAAFARHVREVGRPGVLVNVSSGAASRAYAGWGPYCAAKAAVEQLSRCLAEEERDAGLRVHAVAPGVIDTDMQALIRATPAARFPAVDKFHALARDGAFSSPGWVAGHLLALAFGPAPPEDVVLRLPAERASA